jgi:hypothetical protein
MIYHQITWTSSQTGSQQYYCRSNVYFIIPAWFLFDVQLGQNFASGAQCSKKIRAAIEGYVVFSFMIFSTCNK